MVHTQSFGGEACTGDGRRGLYRTGGGPSTGGGEERPVQEVARGLYRR